MELLIPLFIYSFVHNYTDTALVDIIYYLTAVIFLPFIGYYADKRGAKKLLIIALFLYVVIGGFYFTAGLTSLVIFIMLARFTNGITRSMYKIGEKTYMRKYASEGHLSSSMGMLNSVGDLVRISGVALGGVILYLTHIPLYYLFLFIIPTALISLIPVGALPASSVSEQDTTKSR